MQHYFGAHIDTFEDLIKPTEIVKNVGGNLVQIFMTLPGAQKVTKYNTDELLKYKKYLKDNEMKVVIHSSYIHNLARDWDHYSWWIKNLEIEIKYAHLIGAIGIVIHFGKKLELSTEEAYNNMFSSLLYIHNQTLEYKDVSIILETSTGQGTEVCFKIEDLAYFFNKFIKSDNKVIKDRFRICIDTCHIFSAGYDIKTKNGVETYLQQFENLIGLRYVKLIHLNDCKVDVGEHRDRHQNIGDGFIGITGLKHFFKYFKKLGVGIVLETPSDGYLKEIPKLLKF